MSAPTPLKFDWTGPRDSEMAADGVTLLHPVPGNRWPYGPPADHQSCCGLHRGGLFCDCAASAVEEDGEDPTERGWGAPA